MNPTTISTLAAGAVAALSPIIAKGLEELAKSTFKDAYAALKERLGRDPEGKKAVEKFEADPAEGAAKLQKALTKRLATDAELVRLLAEALEKSGTAETGSLVGKIEAEKVVVAEKINTVRM
jgi:hypothetical protein